MNDQEQEAVRTAMSILGRSRSARKLEALAENRAKLSSPEVRSRQSESQKARREKERAALGPQPDPQPKKPRGRPKKVVEETAD